MLRDLTIHKATPEKKVIVDKVTMKGGISNCVIDNPLINPIPSATTNIASNPAGSNHALPASGPRFDVMIHPPTTLEQANTEVTERSMPAVISTKLCPIAATNRGSRFDRTFLIFVEDSRPGTNCVATRRYAMVRYNRRYSEYSNFFAMFRNRLTPGNPVGRLLDST